MNTFLWYCFVILIKYSLGTSYLIHCDFCLESITANASNQQCSVTNGLDDSSAIGPTVYKPEWNDASWYIYQKSNDSIAIAFNMTWSHSGQHFSNINGYRLSIHLVSSEVTFLRQFEFHLPNSFQPNPADMVFINYPCFGRANDNYMIQPHDTYSLKLNSLPTYHNSSDHLVNEAYTFIDVPDCGDYAQFQHIERCIEASIDVPDFYIDESDHFPPTTTSTTNPETIAEEESNSPPLWLIPVCIIGLIVIVAAVCSILRSKNLDKKEDLKKMVFLTSVTGAEGDDILYLETVDLLGALLRKYGNIEVDSVMWKTCSDYTDWIYNKTTSCDRIVLVCTPLGKSNSQKGNTNDPFTIGLQLLLKNHKKKLWNFQNSQKFYVIYFDDNESKCIPESLVSNKIKCYKLSKKLEWLFKNIAGMNLGSVPDKDAIVELKTNLKLINSDSKKTNQKQCVKNVKYVNGENALLPTDEQQLQNSSKATDIV